MSYKKIFLTKIALLLLLSVLFIVFFLFSSITRRHTLQPDGYIDISALSADSGKNTKILSEDKSSQYVLSLKQGMVVNEGAIITNKHKILTSTHTTLKGQHKQLLQKNRAIDFENPLFFKGNLAVISSPGQENWYHFLLQVLPRLKILKESGVRFDKIYINNLNFSFQRQALYHILDVLNISRDKILEINGDTIVQAEMLLVPSVPFIPSKGILMPEWMQEFLRDSFLNHPSIEKSSFVCLDKIYISRAKAQTRKILNEKELTDCLKKRGFKVLYLEELSPFEQAHLFHNAKIIIGPHGSGFANLLFAQPKTVIIEIDHGSKEPRSFYKRFSKIMKCDYYPFYVDNVTEEQWEEDMAVNITAFEAYLDTILV